MRRSLVLCLVVVGLSSVAARGAEPQRVDVLLRGGRVFDGERFLDGAAVAIEGGKIAAVGKAEDVRAEWEVDCAGLVVAPGFIDLHNHSDAQVVQPETRALVNYLTQGCTTVVTGNCGSGPVDVGGYCKKIDAAGVGANVAHLLPQGGLRGQVIGSTLREPTDAELDEMRRLAAKAMQDGAWGMSTGLIYVPSSYATTAELVAIATVVGEHGGIYASHIRGEGVELLAAVDEALRIGREAELPVHISHFKSSGREAWGLVREAIKQIEKERAAGRKVTADQYPYIASSTSLEATVIPTWARSGGQKELVKRLDDPEQGAKIRTEMEDNLVKRNGGESIRIARYGRRPEWAGKSIAEIAAAEKLDPVELAIQITRGGGASVVNFSMNEDDVRYVMQRPWVATASDGRGYVPGADRPHPRNYGTFPRKLGHYGRDEEVVSLEHALRSMTKLPAEILGLPGRGVIQPGAAADIVVFDPETVTDRATFDQPHQYSAGVVHVFVNGRPAIIDGSPTGALAGRALRHESAKKAKTGDAQETGEQ